ncbi:MAG: ArgR family transcriptional regulator [Actinomycetaceae bacterium]|nr:ArgR family transcriptional regulator [Arcanobacterium sp.]MDD7504989.1 ArgR family transcriptional regulator [Actinomycetaceae bacterium]MDY6143354.1 ArgR family transcriptional regulator [Arcanobacterium sp.]
MPKKIIPLTKAARQAVIAEIITSSRIHSQKELSDALVARGVRVTQATLSRDLMEMRASKEREAGGRQVYVVPEAGAPGHSRHEDGSNIEDRVTMRLARWAIDMLVSAQYTDSDVVLRTLPGGAQLLASAIDDAMLPGVLGCVAGDDTILVITSSTQAASALATRIITLSDERTEERATEMA